MGLDAGDADVLLDGLPLPALGTLSPGTMPSGNTGGFMGLDPVTGGIIATLGGEALKGALSPKPQVKAPYLGSAAPQAVQSNLIDTLNQLMPGFIQRASAPVTLPDAGIMARPTIDASHFPSSIGGGALPPSLMAQMGPTRPTPASLPTVQSYGSAPSTGEDATRPVPGGGLPSRRLSALPRDPMSGLPVDDTGAGTSLPPSFGQPGATPQQRTAASLALLRHAASMAGGA